MENKLQCGHRKEAVSIAGSLYVPIDLTDSLKRIHLKPEIKWKGDVNLVNLESYDKSIRAGEDLLVMQGSQCVGLARALARNGHLHPEG